MINGFDEYNKLQARLQEEDAIYYANSKRLHSANSVAEIEETLNNLPYVLEDEDVALVWRIIVKRENPSSLRILALGKLSIAIGTNIDYIKELLQILVNRREPLELRLVVLDVLQQSSFNELTFNKALGQFKNNLREIISSGGEHFELIEKSLSLLAIYKDGYAQDILNKGLDNDKIALVSPKKALELLSYDNKAISYERLLSLIRKPASTEVRQMVVQLLANHSEAQPLLMKILNNKREDNTVRAASALAMHTLNPDAFLKNASKLLLDNDESEHMKTIYLGAISNSHQLPPALHDSVKNIARDLQNNASLEKLRKASENYLNKLNFRRKTDD